MSSWAMCVVLPGERSYKREKIFNRKSKTVKNETAGKW